MGSQVRQMRLLVRGPHCGNSAGPPHSPPVLWRCSCHLHCTGDLEAAHPSTPEGRAFPGSSVTRMGSQDESWTPRCRPQVAPGDTLLRAAPRRCVLRPGQGPLWQFEASFSSWCGHPARTHLPFVDPSARAGRASTLRQSPCSRRDWVGTG